MNNENLLKINSLSYPRTKLLGITDSHFSQQIFGIENCQTKL